MTIGATIVVSLVAFGIICSGCSSSHVTHPVQTSKTPAPPTAPKRSVAQATTSQFAATRRDALLGAPAGSVACRTTQLRFLVDPFGKVGEPTDDSTHLFALRNDSREACYLTGKPDVTLATYSGRVVAVNLTAASSQVLRQPPRASVYLRPGRQAYFGVGGPHPDCYPVRTIERIEVRVSRSGSSLGAVVEYPLLGGCRSSVDPGSHPLVLTAFAAHVSAILRV